MVTTRVANLRSVMVIRRVRWRARTLAGAWAVLLLAAVWPGVPSAAAPVPADSAAARLYRRACGHAARGHLDLAFERLRESFGHGWARPMQVMSDTCLAPLLADSTWRLKVRDLIRRHAWEDQASMVPPGEPGPRLSLAIRLVDDSGRAVRRAVVELLQPDPRNPCADRIEGWNPRFFACLMSGDSGRILVETVNTFGATSTESVPVAPHLHFTATREGFVTCRGVILLAVDSEPAPRAGVHAAPETTWVAEPIAHPSGLRHYAATVHLRRAP